MFIVWDEMKATLFCKAILYMFRYFGILMAASKNKLLPFELYEALAVEFTPDIMINYTVGMLCSWRTFVF